MKAISTGTENFKEFIDHDYYYVDKSDFIESALSDKVVLFTRPRRFGKTLNMSMLQYFLSIKEKDNAYLFNGLNITKNQEIMKYQNKYPVIFMTFKDMKGLIFDEQIEQFTFLISNIIKEHHELLKSDKLDEVDKNKLEKYRSGESTITEIKNSLLFISRCLKRHYDQKVIILIDEYDVPLQSAYLHNYYDEMTNFMGGVLSSVLKTNDSLEKGILTGCLKTAKESIFTGLNNFTVYSIFNKGKTSRHFGFTQSEIDELLRYYHLEEYQDKIKEWYDGYLFGNVNIYNPWSTLNYIRQIIQEQDDMMASYWANTSGNDIVYNYIKKGNEVLKKEFEELVQGGSVLKTIKPELTYREMEDIYNIYSFLLFTGYLKIKDRVYDDKQEIKLNQYELEIPNKEVKVIYENQFQSYFEEYTQNKKEELVEALRNEEVNKANELLNDILNHAVSFYDNYEAFYHGFMIGLLSGYQVYSNRESGDGRFDIGIKPETILKAYVVIECKKADKLSSLVQVSQEAAKQIVDRRYLEGIKNEGYLKVKGYGISFYEKNCWISIVEG
ncbi:ATP-binding protein [[Clostridium] saccharogumia]|uniref:AAA family ATPase n=1 Tax=Thomasclavelia saccharogumia TaxID=341225 RepID=UPI001D07239D|nr:AAA family ATPase [Thomasclavelia saccharogumia]MCB6705925.1 ATP-binding protein [Thomasclavelia saccharogumia]